jgi:hypothetical protein
LGIEEAHLLRNIGDAAEIEYEQQKMLTYF